jgi:hypothetical protein
MVSAFAARQRLVLGQVKVADKANGDCQEFRVQVGIMGKKDSHYEPTQRTCDTK